MVVFDGLQHLCKARNTHIMADVQKWT